MKFKLHICLKENNKYMKKYVLYKQNLQIRLYILDSDLVWLTKFMLIKISIQTSFFGSKYILEFMCACC